MRKVVYAINLTLDGCFDHTNMVPGDELYEYSINLLRDADVLLYGRKTYELMVPYWPDIAKERTDTKEDIAFADAFCALDMVVVSRTLERAEGKARIVRANLRDEVMKLKEAPGKNILLGGVDLPSQLIELGLVNEFRFVIWPIIAGKGKRLMEGVSLRENVQLKLVESKIFKSGAVAVRYVKQ